MHVGMTRFCREWFSSPDKLAGGLSKIVMAESAPRFASVSEADLGRLVDDKDAKNTKRATKIALRVLQQYLKEKKVPEPQTKHGISNVLKLFYAEARKVDGTSYSKSTLNSLRFGLGRHFKATLGFDIINDPAFAEANKVFGAKCVELKRQGLAKVEHMPPICEEDLKKLYESDVFNQNSPETLQNKVFSRLCCTFVAEEGKIFVNSKKHIFHSARMAKVQNMCAKQQMNSQRTDEKMMKDLKEA